MYGVTFYKRDNGVCPVKSFIHDMDQTSDNQTQLEQILLYVKKLEEFGMNINQRFTREAVKKIENDLYELRPLKVRIFFTIVNNKYVLLHAYRKKSQKAPKQEIANARKELKDYMRQLGDNR